MSGLLNVFKMTTVLGLDVLDEIAGWFFNNILGTVIGLVFWPLCDIFFVILDLFEKLYRMFAGINDGGVKIQGEVVEGDIVLHLMQSNLVQQIFTSVLVLSLFLLIIFTIFAIVKNQYSDKQEPVMKIVNGSIKALLMYFLVPVATVVCLIVGNVVLQAVDGATKSSGSYSSSGMLFVAAAYNGNKLRDDSLDDCKLWLKNYYSLGSINRIEGEIKQKTGVTEDTVDDITSRETMETIASIIDENFANGTLTYAGGLNSQWVLSSVQRYYDFFGISFLTIWVGGAALIGIIGKISWGLVSRVFKMTLYFALSPAVMATFPLDSGKALGSWRGEMVKNGTMAIVTVGVLNVLYSIIPVFKNIDVGGGIGGALIKLFIMLIAFNSAKDLIGSISGWFGTGDALAEGAKTKDTVTKPIANAAKKGLAFGVGAYKGAQTAGEHGKNKLGGAFAGVLGQTSWGKNIWGEEAQKAKKAAEESTKSFYTSSIRGEKRKDKVAEWEAREAINKEIKGISANEAKIDAAFEAEVNQRGYVKGSAKYDALQARYEKEKKSLRTNASFITPLYAEREKVLDSMQKQNDEDAKFFAAFDSYSKAQASMDKYREMFAQHFKGGNISDGMWQNILKGDLSHVSKHADYTKVKELYEMHGSGMFETQRELDGGLQQIQNLYKLGDDSRKFVDRFKAFLDMEVDSATGDATGVKGIVAGENKNFVNEIEIVRAGLNKAADELDALRKEIKSDKAKKFDEIKKGNVDSKELETIGKSLGK